MEVVGGLDRDLAAKMAEKYSPVREREAQEWIESVLERSFPESTPFQTALKDGTILCEVINKVSAGAQIKINQSKMPFKQMENINAFLQASEKMGVNRHELFQTVDLFEAKNMAQVIDSIYALSRCAEKQGYQGQRIGPKLAEKKTYNFSVEKLAEAKNVIPALTAFNSGATLSGTPAFGSRREIGGVDIGKTGGVQ
ncbi:Calponin-3 [Physocladia obscura]|uniref:Calponin-3 n=1 Tax=Physocladia obscura TaxID=109957 RepID=A0AAD5SZJ7_9FUNG|nr:Calponin-3 [Physocladia obscura]